MRIYEHVAVLEISPTFLSENSPRSPSASLKVDKKQNKSLNLLKSLRRHEPCEILYSLYLFT